MSQWIKPNLALSQAIIEMISEEYFTMTHEADDIIIHSVLMVGDTLLCNVEFTYWCGYSNTSSVKFRKLEVGKTYVD